MPEIGTGTGWNAALLAHCLGGEQGTDRLSDLHEQDSYSYALASVYIGAADEAELTARFEQVVAALPFEIENVGS